MTDTEMNLVGRLGEVEPLSDEVFDEARTVLQAAIATEGKAPVRARSDRPKRRRRALALRSGVVAGVAAAVAAVAIVVAMSGHPPTAPTTAKHVASPLIQLADYVVKSAAPSGDATLVARTTDLGGGKSVTVYDLYADNGEYFFSRTEAGLPEQVSADNNVAGGLFAREIAAAKLAATGDVQRAGEEMASAPLPAKYVPQTTTETVSASALAKEPGVFHLGELVGTDYDNYVWENSQDALIAGAGDPQVRAGVLQLLATLPGVTVTSGTFDGRPTLVLTAGLYEVGPGGIEQLTIDANTGIPISAASGASEASLSPGVTYQVSRVTTSDVAAGKF